MAAEFGTDSPFYIARVLGEFPTEGSLDSLIKESWLEPAYLRWEEQAGLRAIDAAPVVGLDVARSLGRDESVAAVSQRARLHKLVAWRSRDLVSTADRAIGIAADTWREWQCLSHLPSELPVDIVRPVLIIVDAPGVGSGAHDEIRRRKHPVGEYWGWRPSSDPLRLLNQRSQVYWNLRRLLENGVAALPRDPLLREEMLATEWSEDTKGRIVIASKDLIRVALGRSPDRLDATTIALSVSSPDPRQRWSQFRPIY
jgi:hypothetical protein